MRRSRRRHLEPTARTGGALEPPSLLHGRLGGLRRAGPARPALRRQGPDPRHRAGPFPPAALAGAVPPPHLRGLQGQAHGGRLDRAVRPLRRSRRGQRTPIYASLRPWREYLEGLRALRDERNMLVIQIAHETIKRFDSPETDPY